MANPNVQKIVASFHGLVTVVLIGSLTVTMLWGIAGTMYTFLINNHYVDLPLLQTILTMKGVKLVVGYCAITAMVTMIGSGALKWARGIQPETRKFAGGFFFFAVAFLVAYHTL